MNEAREHLVRSSYVLKNGQNFDQAEKVVVVGRYEGSTLHADQILVKCPSKYDDMAADEYSKEAAEGKETH